MSIGIYNQEAYARSAQFGFEPLRPQSAETRVEPLTVHGDSVVLLAEREVQEGAVTRQRLVLKSGVELLYDLHNNSVKISFMGTNAPPSVLRAAYAAVGAAPTTVYNSRLGIEDNGNFVLENDAMRQRVAGNGEYELTDKFGGAVALINPLDGIGSVPITRQPDGRITAHYSALDSTHLDTELSPFLTSAQIYGSGGPDHSAAPRL